MLKLWEPSDLSLNSNFAPAVKQATSQRPAALPHREPRCSYILFQFRNQTPTVTLRGAYCVIVGSIFDANQQNKTRLENHFYHRDIITIAKLTTWAPCDINLWSKDCARNAPLWFWKSGWILKEFSSGALVSNWPRDQAYLIEWTSVSNPNTHPDYKPFPRL